MINIVFHMDPGHGWFEVTANQLKDIDLDPSIFSTYSYRDGNTYYLEEDRDASIFIAHLHQINRQHELDITFRSSDEDSFIRDLPRVR